MSRKNVLLPYKVESAHSLAASFTTTPTMVTYTDNIGYQINATTSDAVGFFVVQASVDYQPATPQTPGVTGNWITLSLGGDLLTLSSSSDSLIINLSMLPFNAVRLSYTRTSGTGTADVYIMHKQVGG